MDTQAAINAARFVQFAANNWNKNGDRTDLNGLTVVGPDNVSPAVQGKTFKVARTIYANDLATDINGDRPAIEGMKTMGIVAVNEADPGEIVVAVRGTLTVWEWIQDCRFLLRPVLPCSRERADRGRLHVNVRFVLVYTWAVRGSGSRDDVHRRADCDDSDRARQRRCRRHGHLARDAEDAHLPLRRPPTSR